MPDTIRTESDLLSSLVENTQGSITAQNIRDFVVSTQLDSTTAHLSNFNNPHEVTAGQVGAPASIAGVSHPGGDIGITAGSNITVTPDNEGKTITIAATGGGGGSGNLNYRGTWSPTTAYSANDEIQYGNTTYVALQSTTGNEPPNSTYWQSVGTLGTVFNVKDYGASGSANQYTDSITASTNTLTLGSAHDFQPGHGIVVRGAGASHTIPAPSAPVLGNAGTAGSTSYYYRLCSLTGDGGWSAVGSATTTSTGTSALGTTNYNNVCWPQVSTGASGGNTGNTLGGFVIFGRTNGSDLPLAIINAACTNCRAVHFQASGYTNAVQSDIGKALTSQSGYNGVLVAFDNSNRIWYVIPTDFLNDTFAATGTSLSIFSGTGSGTSSAAPITSGGSDLAYYWSDKGDLETYQYRTLSWRRYFEHVAGDWIFADTSGAFNHNGHWYKMYKGRWGQQTGGSAPSLTNTLNWTIDGAGPDGDVYWRREEPFFPTSPPGAAESNALITKVTAVSGDTLTLAANAGNTVSGEIAYHDDTVACQNAHSAMLAAGTNASVYFPAGNYQMIVGTLANDNRWTSFGAVPPYNVALFSVSTGQGIGWELDNNCQIRVLALAANAYISDPPPVTGQQSFYYSLLLFETVLGFSVRGKSQSSRITWEPYGTTYAENADNSSGDGGSHNGWIMSADYFGGASNVIQGVSWDNLLIEGWPIVTSRSTTNNRGCQGEKFQNVTFDYGGGYHDNCLFTQGGTRIDECMFIGRRLFKSRAIYGVSWTTYAYPIQSVNTSTNVITTVSDHNLTLGQPIVWRPTPGIAMPSGAVVANKTYYAGSIGLQTLSLYPTVTDAINGTNVVTITSTVSSGIFNITYHNPERTVVTRTVFDRSGSSGRYSIEARSDNFTVSDSKFSNCDYYITLDSAVNTIVTNCTFTNSGIMAQSPLMALTGNTFLDSILSITNASDVSVSGNSFMATGNYTPTGMQDANAACLQASGATRLSITGNVFDTAYTNAVYLSSCDQTEVVGNSITGLINQYVVRVLGTGFVAVKSNVINVTSSTGVVYLIQADSGTPTLDISGNWIGGGPSIFVSGATSVRITNNYCAGKLNIAAGPALIQDNNFADASNPSIIFTGSNAIVLDNQFAIAPSNVTGVTRGRDNTLPAGIDYFANTNVNGITYTPNAAMYATHDLTLTATSNTIAAPTGSNVGDMITIFLKQNSTGGFTATFNAAYRMGTYSQTTTANKMDVLTFRYDGTNWNLVSLVQSL